jgi:putative membrane protein
MAGQSVRPGGKKSRATRSSFDRCFGSRGEYQDAEIIQPPPWRGNNVKLTPEWLEPLHVLRLRVNSAEPFRVRRTRSEGAIVIRGYSDHAANERTFLAWLRTGIAVIAFGFVVEKFNLFVLTIASTAAIDAARRSELERLSGPLGRYEGLTLILIGLIVVIIAFMRFAQTRRLLDDQEMHSASSSRVELVLTAVLALIVAGFSVYLVLYHAIS